MKELFIGKGEHFVHKVFYHITEVDGVPVVEIEKEEIKCY